MVLCIQQFLHWIVGQVLWWTKSVPNSLPLNIVLLAFIWKDILYTITNFFFVRYVYFKLQTFFPPSPSWLNILNCMRHNFRSFPAQEYYKLNIIQTCFHTAHILLLKLFKIDSISSIWCITRGFREFGDLNWSICLWLIINDWRCWRCSIWRNVDVHSILDY